jgi:hypothetical protein
VREHHGVAPRRVVVLEEGRAGGGVPLDGFLGEDGEVVAVEVERVVGSERKQIRWAVLEVRERK